MIVVIGDSISAGQYCETAFPELLGARNKGVNSDTTRLGLERFPADVQQSGAATCVIQFGHNDANRWHTDRGLPRVSRLAFGANLQEMIHRCRLFGIEPYLCTIIPVLRAEEYQRDLDAYDHTLREVAGITATPVIDTYQAFIRYDLKDLLIDGLHLSVEGHKLYAQTIREAL